MKKPNAQQISIRLPVKVLDNIEMLADIHKTDRTTEILRACEIYIEQTKKADSEDIEKYFDYRKEKDEISNIIDQMSKKIESLEKEVEGLKGN